MSYTNLWLLWLAIFCIIEGFALANKRQEDTLSEHVWEWFCVKRGGSRKWLRYSLLVIFLLWLTIHFLTGGEV